MPRVKAKPVRRRRRVRKKGWVLWRDRFLTISKAIVSFFGPLITSIVTGLENGLTGWDFLRGAAAGLIMSFFVWLVPNKQEG